MDIITKHIPPSTNRRPGKAYAKYNFNPQYITIHNTGNPTSTALNERLWLTNPSNTRVASWHYVIDEKKIIEAIPPNELAWHAGDFEGNNTSIGVEICERGNQDIVLDRAVKFVAYLLKLRGWGIERLKTHKDWSGKNCPRLILPELDEFKKRVEGELKVDMYEKWKQDIEPHLKAIWELIPKPEEKKVADVKHYVEGETQIVEINPLDLKLICEPIRGIDVKHNNYINASFVWWEDYPKNTKPYPTSMLVYDGKIIINMQPNGFFEGQYKGKGVPTPTFIIYKDGTVTIKDCNDLSTEASKIHLAVSVVQAFPQVRQQGFVPYVGWSTVAYACNRLGIFYRKSDNKVILTFRKNSTIDRLNDTAKNLKVDFGGSLDSGGSANFIVNGKKINATTRWMYAGLTW